MSNFLALLESTDARLNEYFARVYRIKQHIGREEHRAAQRQLVGLSEELADFYDELSMPLEYMILGSQLGFFASSGSLVRGRLPAALLGLAGGWLYGHGSLEKLRRDIVDLSVSVHQLNEHYESLRGAAMERHS